MRNKKEKIGILKGSIKKGYYIEVKKPRDIMNDIKGERLFNWLIDSNKYSLKDKEMKLAYLISYQDKRNKTQLKRCVERIWRR
jgi:hypothetical protein